MQSISHSILISSFILFLLSTGVVSAVVVDSDVDFNVDVFTLNTVKTIIFDSITIGDSYIHLRYNNSDKIYNISFLCNVSYVVLNDTLFVDYDFYSPIDYSYSTYIDVWYNGMVVDTFTPVVYQKNDSFKHGVDSRDVSSYDEVYVGIYIYTMNDTIRYYGYKLFDEKLEVSYMSFIYWLGILGLLGFFYVMAEWRRDVTLYMLSSVIALVLAYTSLSFNYPILFSAGIFLFAIYNSFLALAYSLYFRARKE